MDPDSPDPQTPSSDLGPPTPSSTSSEPFVYSFASLNDLTLDLSSLQDLVTRGSWRSVLDKVARARSLSLLPNPHDHLIYLTYNVLALFKLRRFAEASTEIDTVEDFDSTHYKYETYPQIYQNRSGSMVPFSLRWLHALIPLKVGQRQEGLDRLYALVDFVRQKIKDREMENSGGSLNVWKKREVFVMNCLIGQHLINKEYGVCLTFIRNLLERDSLNPVLLSKLGYILMQIGDLEGAKSAFDRVEGFLKEGQVKFSELLSENELMNLVNRNKALVYLVGKDYVSAIREYEECIERDNADAVAINNKAICLMYLRDLSDSIKVLESALERVPTVALNETLVVNLCSMYELAYVNHSDIKRTLSNWIARVAPDDFDSSCTRI